MNRIVIKLDKPELIKIGQSKFLGSPDLPEGFIWPDELDFLCQINCAEVAPFDKDGLLPKSGMLYFFYDFDEMPYRGQACVRYFPGDLSELHSSVLLDEDGEGIRFTDFAINFESNNESGYLDGDSHFLLGQPSVDWFDNEPEIWSKQLLLQIDSFETEGFEITFCDCGILCFFIDREDLKNKNFSRCNFVIISS